MDKVYVTVGFRGHNDLDNLPGHAVFQDTQAALRNQDTTLTLQFNKEAAIHNVDECVKFGKLVMDHLPEEVRGNNRQIRLLIGEGKLDEHTDNPHKRTRVERHTFPDIMHPMVSLMGGLALDSQIFQLQPLRRSA